MRRSVGTMQRAQLVPLILYCSGSAATVFWLFVLLVASSFLHNLSYFYLMRNSGAVATGVIAGPTP